MKISPTVPERQDLVRCPYLGLHDDSKTSLAYPSPWNYCYRAKSLSAVSLSHQTTACLNEGFKACEVFLSTQSIELPHGLKNIAPPLKKTRLKTGVWGLIVFIALSSLLVIMTGKPWVEEGKPLSTAPETIPNIPTVMEVDTFPDIPLFTTPWVGPTFISSPLVPRKCGHELDVMFGSENRFILHRITAGENLQLYANRYQTAANAILYINHNMEMPVWENAVIVIPIGTMLVIGVPPFETLELESTTITTDELAERLGSDIQQFRKYNVFDDSCEEFSGWILIPRKRSGT